MDTLGQVVRRAREEQGISQRALCLRVGVSSGYLSRLENDHAGYTGSEGSCIRIADALGLDRDELMRLAGHLPSDIEQFILENPKELKNLRRKVKRATAQRSQS